MFEGLCELGLYVFVCYPYKDCVYTYVITMMSKWAQWRLKWPASRLFAQPFIQAQI